MGEETLTLIVGIAISIVVVHWIFSNRGGAHNGDATTQRPAALSSEGAVDQLAGMFPHIPATVIRAEAGRAASMQAAIERLLVIGLAYNGSEGSTAGLAGKGSSSLKTVKEVAAQLSASPIEAPSTVDESTWSNDSSVRQRLLAQRKEYMLQRAKLHLCDYRKFVSDQEKR